MSIRGGVELVGLKEQQENIVAEVVSGSSEKMEIQAKWIIGCDGSHSFIRKYLDLSFLGKVFPAVFSLADVELDWKYSHEEAYVFFCLRGILVVIPLPEKNRYRLIFQLKRCQNKKGKTPLPEDNLEVDLKDPTIEEVQKIISKFADEKAIISNPKWLANFYVNSRLTSRYRVGNFFLAGDASHIHSPIGGQGMNTGLQDAFNLAWKIALVHKWQLCPAILDTYQDERHAIAKRLLKGTEMATFMATLKKQWQVLARNFFLSKMLKVSSIQRRLIFQVSQVSICYPKSDHIFEKGNFTTGIKVGTRVPNRILQTSNGKIEIYDLLKNPKSFFVFLFAGEKNGLDRLQDIEDKLRSLKIPLEIVFIGLKPFADEQILTDPDGKVHKDFGASKGAAYVIRPDTYISYHQTPLEVDSLLSYFKSSLKICEF